MPNVSQSEAPGTRSLPGASVDQLAATALSCVAQRQRGSSRGLLSPCVARLEKAVTDGGTADALATIRLMTKAGIAPEEIADHYIPAVARRLGDQWCADQISFATVTIGVARLQGLLREVEEMTLPQRRLARDGASLLVLVAEGLDHTLGAMVLTGQLRRSGHAVRLILGAEPDAVAAAVRATRFDGVLISAPEGTAAERLRPLVAAVRRVTRTPPPVVIGGTIIDEAERTGTDIRTLTGADLATSDPDEALRLCGLKAETRDASERGSGL